MAEKPHGWKREASFLGVLTSRVRTEHFPFTDSTPASRASRSLPSVLTRLEPQAGAIFVAHRGHAVNGLHVHQDLVVLRRKQRGSELQIWRPALPRHHYVGREVGEGCWAMGWGRGSQSPPFSASLRVCVGESGGVRRRGQKS